MAPLSASLVQQTNEDGDSMAALVAMSMPRRKSENDLQQCFGRMPVSVPLLESPTSSMPVHSPSTPSKRRERSRVHSLPPARFHELFRLPEESCVMEEVVPESTSQELKESLDDFQWNTASQLVQDFPSIAQATLYMVCQGEKCTVTPLLYAVSLNAPLSVLETLVRAHPAALFTPEERGGRWPLHMALLRGGPNNKNPKNNVANIGYLLNAWPKAVLACDADNQTPLHYAVQYADSRVILKILRASPEEVVSGLTKKGKTVLHLLVSTRCQSWTSEDHNSSNMMSIDTLETILNAHPKALHQADCHGRLPLHCAAGQPYCRWDVLQVLCAHHPGAVLGQDEDGKIPLQLLQRFRTHSTDHHHSSHDDVVAQFLQDRTSAERRKSNKLFKLLSKVHRGNKKQTLPTKPTVVDLMNCYG